MTRIGDSALEHLRAVAEQPDLSHTRYEVRDLLGRGGMGAVYAAYDRELGRLVALKVTSIAASTSDSIARLRKEAGILAELEHPNIIPVHDVGVLTDGRCFYTMKLVQGRRLDEHVQDGRPLAERLQIFERICDAVAFAHARGVIHRDLKPANIMVGPFGEVLVLDWGVAKAGPERLALRAGSAAEPAAGSTGAGTVIGTRGFMSPEQALGEPDVDARSDIHALGAILRFLLATSETRQDGGRQQTRRTPRPLAAIAGRASAVDRDARYQSVGDLAADLSRYRDALRVHAYRESVLERIVRVAGRYRLPLTLILAYVLMRLVLLLALRS